jgi:hypothetical protein
VRYRDEQALCPVQCQPEPDGEVLRRVRDTHGGCAAGLSHLFHLTPHPATPKKEGLPGWTGSSVSGARRRTLPLHPSMELDVREHAFLAGTHSVSYSFVRIKGLANVLHGGSGMYMDRFVTQNEQGRRTVRAARLSTGSTLGTRSVAWALFRCGCH